ncbi:MAG: hypothetical protein R6V85_12295 [Polyangia bacterium]
MRPCPIAALVTAALLSISCGAAPTARPVAGEPPLASPPSNETADVEWDCISRRARSLGYEHATEASRLRVVAGERARVRFELRAGRCYLFAVGGGDGMEAIEARLKRRGRMIGADLAGRTSAWIDHCAERDEELTLEIDTLGGAGRLTVGAFSARREEVLHRVGPPLEAVEARASAEQIGRSVELRLRRLGYETPETLLVAEMDIADRREVTLHLDAGRCVRLVAVGGPGVRDIDLKVETMDEKAEQVDRFVGESAESALCSDRRVDLRVEVTIAGGSGQVRLTLHRLPIVPLPRLSGPLPLGLREAAARFAEHGMGAARLAGRPRLDEKDALWRLPIELEAGRCHGLAAVSSSGRLERLALVSDDGGIAASSSGPARTLDLASCVHGEPRHEITVAPESDPSEEPPRILVFTSEQSVLPPLVTP